jgi:hypothetical protein
MFSKDALKRLVALSHPATFRRELEAAMPRSTVYEQAAFMGGSLRAIHRWFAECGPHPSATRLLALVRALGLTPERVDEIIATGLDDDGRPLGRYGTRRHPGA